MRETNDSIYKESGLKAVFRRLALDGIAAFWSATISVDFEERLDALPWRWHRDDIRLIGGRADAFHHIYLAGNGSRLAVDGRPHSHRLQSRGDLEVETYQPEGPPV